jgi:acyl-CoA synthetase (AMP-forming)/AMP-acid ligase II
VLPFYFEGATQVTMNVPDLNRFCENVQKERITSTMLVPTVLYRFLEFDVEAQYDLSSLATVFYGASPMSLKKLKGLQAKFGNIFVQVYGATEAYPPVTLLGKAEHQPESEEETKRLGSAGKPVVGYEVKIVDEHGHEVPSGQTGEAWVRGPGIIKGYFKNREQTEAEFTKDGWWKTGDMMCMDPKGYIYIVDRKKDMIISGGFNVYATEVEEALNAHPAVLMSAVIGIPHEDWGEAIHAEVILKEHANVEASELVDFCKERKGKYKAPKTVAFVQELPVSAVGKVLRRKVREKYWTGEERQVH